MSISLKALYAYRLKFKAEYPHVIRRKSDRKRVKVKTGAFGGCTKAERKRRYEARKASLATA